MVKQQRIIISAGEASGDAYGAALVREIDRISAERNSVAPAIEAIGGRQLRSVGAQMIHDSSNWGALGIMESMKVLPRVFLGYRKAKSALKNRRPGLFVPIDYGFVNIKLCKIAKKHGWKVLYWMPPGSWRRDKQGADLPVISDAVVTQFPWSKELLTAMGANAYWFGHPMKQLLESTNDSTQHTDVVAILPGSRSHEIRYNLTPISEAMQLHRFPNVAAQFAVAWTITTGKLQSTWTRLAPERTQDVFIQGATAKVLSTSRVAVVCSGTATLEAALCGCPSVVVYMGSKVMKWEYLIRKPKFRFISLPNILLDRPVLPELIIEDANPQRIAEELDRIWEGDARERQLKAFRELSDILGPNDAVTRTAELALSFAKELSDGT